MHTTLQINDTTYWVGVNDYQIQYFENTFPLENGISYHAYIIKDDKNVLIDTVDSSVCNQFIENIQFVLQNEKLDYLIIQHMEPDHCGCIERIIELYPDVILVGNAKTFSFFKQFYQTPIENNKIVVKNSQELIIGKSKLCFWFAPFVHWPEVMFTYDEYNQCLFSSDCFGSFQAISGNLYMDQVRYDEKWLSNYRRYYANIMGKYGNNVISAFQKIETLPISYLCPAHGLIVRDKDNINRLMKQYRLWANYENEYQSVLFVYASMYGNTRQVIEHIALQLGQKGIENIQMMDVSQTDVSYILEQMYAYSHIVITLTNYNSQLYFPMDALLREYVSLNIQNKTIGLITNMTWGGNAIAIGKEILSKAKKHQFLETQLDLKSAFHNEDNQIQLEAFITELASSIQKGN